VYVYIGTTELPRKVHHQSIIKAEDINLEHYASGTNGKGEPFGDMSLGKIQDVTCLYSHGATEQLALLNPEVQALLPMCYADAGATGALSMQIASRQVVCDDSISQRHIKQRLPKIGGMPQSVLGGNTISGGRGKGNASSHIANLLQERLKDRHQVAVDAVKVTAWLASRVLEITAPTDKDQIGATDTIEISFETAAELQMLCLTAVHQAARVERAVVKECV
jgi:hypothetical protein